jgi:hypothetical protein
MPDQYNRTTEAELSEVALRIMSERTNGQVTFAELIAEIPRRILLTEEDREQSQTRPAEEVWEQRVRNMKSHKNAEGNIVAEGYATEIPNGLAITDAGRRRAAR